MTETVKEPSAFLVDSPRSLVWFRRLLGGRERRPDKNGLARDISISFRSLTTWLLLNSSSQYLSLCFSKCHISIILVPNNIYTLISHLVWKRHLARFSGSYNWASLYRCKQSCTWRSSPLDYCLYSCAIFL